jgi:hypothetical protein
VSETPKPLTASQTQALVTLLAGHTNAEAAEAAGCCERTVERWRQLPRFRAALQQGQDEAVAVAYRLLCDCSLRAAQVLQSALADENVRVRLKAADSILRRVEWAGIDELKRALEELSETGKGNPPLQPWAG